MTPEKVKVYFDTKYANQKADYHANTTLRVFGYTEQADKIKYDIMHAVCKSAVFRAILDYQKTLDDIENSPDITREKVLLEYLKTENKALQELDSKYTTKHRKAIDKAYNDGIENFLYEIHAKDFPVNITHTENSRSDVLNYVYDVCMSVKRTQNHEDHEIDV